MRQETNSRGSTGSEFGRKSRCRRLVLLRVEGETW
jgi:hypothetical protein